MVIDIVIVGAGGFGREVKFIIERINKVKLTYNLLGFYDDNTKLPSMINGIPLLGSISTLLNCKEDINVVLGISSPDIKKNIVKTLRKNKFIFFPVLIDPNAIIGGDNIYIEEGTVVCAGVILTCNIKIEKFVTLNLYCTVGHDTTIDDFSSFMPSVNISGEVSIGRKVYVGTGARIINRLDIGDETIIGAGAVVTKDLPGRCTAVGVPANIIK